jgi:hypothetical protein
MQGTFYPGPSLSWMILHKTNPTCYEPCKVGKVANAARRGSSKTQVSRKTELPELGIRILKRAYKGEWRKVLDLLKQN